MFCIKETLIEYVEKHSECYLVSLDAEKAFDKLWRFGLFHKLMKKLNKREWLILKRYYDSSEAKIINNDAQSNIFKVVTGVKQGGILSPFLFNIFVDPLIESIIESKVGAKIGAIDTNIISYCDDIFLLFSCPNHGQLMLDKCQDYAIQWRLKFNSKKSIVTTFGTPIFKTVRLTLNKEILEFKNNMKILGHVFNSNDLNENEYLIEKFAKVRRSFFSLNAFGLKPGGLNLFCQSFIYNTFCLSKLTYSMEIMSVNVKTINCLNVMQNNLLRYLLQMSNHNHLSSIQQVLNIFNFKHLFYKYKLGFRKQLESSQITKEILSHLLIQKNKMNKSASFICSFNELSNLLAVNMNELGLKKNLDGQLDMLNENFNKKPQQVQIVRFCLENYQLKEHRDNLRTITSYENQDFVNF